MGTQTQVCRLPLLLFWEGVAEPAGASELPHRTSLPTPPCSSRRALLPGPGNRPTLAWANGSAAQAPPSPMTDQWRRDAGNSLIQRGPITAWLCIGPPRAGRVAGRWPPAPPRSPLTRCLVSPSSCSKPRGRAGGYGAAGLREGTLVDTASVAAVSQVLTLAPVKSRRTLLPAPSAESAHGDSGALPQLRGLQLLAPASGPGHSERAPSQNPKDSCQRRQPGPPR